MSDQKSPAKRPIISIAEARKLLGKEDKYFSDEDIIKLVDGLSEIAKSYLRMRRNKNFIAMGIIDAGSRLRKSLNRRPSTRNKSR